MLYSKVITELRTQFNYSSIACERSREEGEVNFRGMLSRSFGVPLTDQIFTMNCTYTISSY